MSQASPATLARLAAQTACGAPETEREQKLFDALQDALEQLYDTATLHAECNERIKDAVDELVKADKSRLRDAPEPDANLIIAKRTLEDRRHAEPLVAPTGYDYDAGRRYERMRVEREATDLLEQLVEEVEAYRKLAGVTP